MQNKELFKQMFSEYCQSEIKAGHCEEYDCQWCAVNMAWDKIFCTEYDDIDEIADELQTFMLNADNDVVEDFCGFALDGITKEEAVYQVMTQMPDEVLLEYHTKFIR